MKKIIIIAIIILSIILFVSCFKANKEPTKWSEYVVQSGDTVCDISIGITPDTKDYRETQYYIAKKNNLKNSMIYPGQKILVPVYE